MGYGGGQVDRSTAATEDTAPQIGEETLAGAYSFSAPVKKCHITLAPECPCDFAVRWNGTAGYEASATEWDDYLQPGDKVVSPDGIRITEVQIYPLNGTTPTNKTHFQVRGW